MLLIGLVLLELTLLFIYIYSARYYLYLFLLFIYVLFWYWSGAEETGNEAKPVFRNWCLWRKWTAVQHVWSNREEFATLSKDHTYLFIVTPNMTNMALISGFGLHGGKLPVDLDVRYILPSLLLCIPILREILLWSGACCAKGNKDVEGTILKLLRKGKSVAYCPTGMRDYFGQTKTFDLEPAIYQFAHQYNIRLVPVLVEREADRYNIITHKIQEYTFNWFFVPIPLLFGPRIFGAGPPPKITLSIGTACDPSLHTEAGSYKKLVEGQIEGFLFGT